MNKNAKILLVDDVQGIVTFAQSVLNGLGFQSVDTACEVKEALGMVMKHKHDVIFLDINLPVENDISLISQIQSISPNTQVVMCSSQSNDDQVKEAISAGADGFLVKPITEFNMSSVIERLSQTC